MERKHSIWINEKLYFQIKEFCKRNNLKINEYVEKLIKQCFIEDFFGDIPFGKINKNSESKKNEVDEKIQEEIKLPQRVDKEDKKNDSGVQSEVDYILPNNSKDVIMNTNTNEELYKENIKFDKPKKKVIRLN